MFQPAGVRTLLQMRPLLPERPSTDSAKATSRREDAENDFKDRPRCPTAPPAFGSRMDSLCELTQPSALSTSVDDAESEVEEDAGTLLQEASSMLQQLQNGWDEERRSEIDQLWRECEADYGMNLSREAPGAPTLGSLRARAGYGAAGLLGGVRSGAAAEEPSVDATASAAVPPESPEEIEADMTAEAAKRDLEKARELRRRIEAKLAASPGEALEATAAANALKQRAAQEDKADARRLARLRTEVERLRAQAQTTANVASTGSGSEVTSSGEATAVPTSTAAAAMAAVDLNGPELLALDEWMEDLRVLRSDMSAVDSEGGQRQMKAVASPMRVRNPTGLRSPRSARLSPPSSPSKKDMARVAEQRAMEWAAGQPSPPRAGQPKSGQPSPRRTPKTPMLSTRGELLASGYPEAGPGSLNSTSAVERQLDDILNELDEIDRIHDDVCMLSHP